MAKILKEMYTILVLIKNLIFRKKHYTLRFVAERNGSVKRWYYDFKHWGFSHGNLEMVAGADALCEMYANGEDEVTIDIVASKHIDAKAANDYDFYEGLKTEGSITDRILYGRNYQGVKTDKNGDLVIRRMWICPVTLFVLGRYPNCLYVKKHV